MSSRPGVLLATAVLLCAGCGGPPPPAPTPASAAALAAPTSEPTTTTAAPTTTVPPTTTAAPAGELVYTADWSVDLDGWTGNEDWSASQGELLCRGQLNDYEAGAVAPVDVSALDGYAVEAEIALLRYEITNGSFGVMVHLQEDGAGYAAGHDEADEEAVLRTQGSGRTLLDARPFVPGTDWHSYRIEVRGNELAVFIDGAPVLSTTDNTFLDGRVGLWSRGAQLAVRRFEVTQLPAA